MNHSQVNSRNYFQFGDISSKSYLQIIFEEEMYTIIQSTIISFNPYAAGGKLSQYKMMQKTWRMTETLANGYSSESTQQELSNEY